jgi:hypothetical protein
VIIGLAARVRITCEECAYIALQSDRQRRDRRPPAESSESWIPEPSLIPGSATS